MNCSSKFVTFTALFLLIFGRSAISQDIIISGTVRDQNTLEELRGVNILVKGSNLGTTTNLSGKYRLVLDGLKKDEVVVFQHIAYLPKEVSVQSLKNMSHVDLQPRIIPLRSVEIEEEGLDLPEIRKDLPQTVSVIEASDFEIRGYVDAGDLLRIDHSVQVSEEISGKKTVAIRGGNSDEVIVLFNGVKMNSSFDNIFDLSLIDLEDVQRFEVIKGSNTALYGPEAFSGVINIVPKIEHDYTIRFQQRLGTYRSGNWGLHLYRQFGRLHSSYSIKRGGLSRSILENQGDIENKSKHHTANLVYRLARNSSGQSGGTLSAMWINTSLDHDEERDFDRTIDNFNNLFSLRYQGEIVGVRDLDLSFSYKDLSEKQQFIDVGALRNRDITDRTFALDAKKEVRISEIQLLLGYRFQQSEVDFLDRFRTQSLVNLGLEEGTLKRQHHGGVGILKYHSDADSDFLHSIDLDLSARYDVVIDEQTNAMLREDNPNTPSSGVGLFEDRTWNETMVKFATQFSGYRDEISFDGYMNFGANTKFPTLFQLISRPAQIFEPGRLPNLNPEKNRSLEIGINLSREIRNHRNIYGWQISGNYFQNHYENKFVEISNPSFPISEFENVDNARISGFETKSSVFLFEKKISVDVGISKYFIPEKTAFPFKSDNKRTVTFNINHAGYSFQVFWFNEGEQTGQVRFSSGELGEFSLESTTNVDAHISKTFQVGKMKLFGNFSGRNLLNDNNAVLEGLSLRDRRVYLTLGAQY